MGTLEVKPDPTRTTETTPDPTRVKESKDDPGGHAVMGGDNTSESKLVSQPGAKKAVWQTSELKN